MNNTLKAIMTGIVFVWIIGICMISLHDRAPIKNDNNRVKIDVLPENPAELETQPEEEPRPLPTSNINYSPGGEDWHIPTKEETKEWKQVKYIEDLHAWAKPKLDRWHCQSCKRKLGEEFRFLDRNGNTIRFKCKCHCGHEHTITLRSGK